MADSEKLAHTEGGASDSCAHLAVPVTGYLEHVESGLFVHPLGGKGKVDARLILHAPVREPRLLFRLHPDGSLEHMESGLFVHPWGGTAVTDVRGCAFVVLGGDVVGDGVGVCVGVCVLCVCVLCVLCVCCVCVCVR